MRHDPAMSHDHDTDKRPEGSVDAAGMSALFAPRGREEDRGLPEEDAARIVGAYVFALDPGVARAKARGRG